MTELCRCGHALDHRNKRCSHPVMVEDEGRPVEKMCECPSGIRTDVFLVAQMGQLIRQQQMTLAALSDLFGVLLVAHDLEVTEQGQIRRTVKLTL